MNISPPRTLDEESIMRIDINCDLGEGFGPWTMGDDAAIMPLITSANIACGFHAGDPQIMRQTIELAAQHGVALGAHPGFQDLAGFGRRPCPSVTAQELENIVAYQIGAFAGLCAMAGHRMAHVKTHGALGNACAADDDLADAIARAIRAVDRTVLWFTLPGTATDRAAQRHGLRAAREVYADRSYGDDFNLAPRSQPGAVIHDADVAVERVMTMISEGCIRSINGLILESEIDSICVHGDSPQAVTMARSLRDGLLAKGVQTCTP